jgi:glycerate-2-kinase
MKVKNGDRLVAQGDTASRETMVAILEETLQALDGYRTIANLLRLEGSILRIGDRRWDLQTKRRVWVVGAGKAANAMARAVETVLGQWISGGLVIVKALEDGDRLHRIDFAVGGHPLPNHEGFLATKRILELVDAASPEDLFVGLISGGSSALMNHPVQGVTLEDEIEVTRLLLERGARILELNAVRRHISETNGGRLAERIEKTGAEMINIVISDSVGDRPTVDPTRPAVFFGTPVAPDRTSLDDARQVLRRYDLLPKAPRSVVDYLNAEEPGRETPKVFGSRIQHFIVAGVADSAERAKEAASRRGITPVVLTTFLEGESREAGTFLSSVTREILLNRRPVPPPCLLIASGETTTRIEGAAGRGGPSQELALSFALEISGLEGVCGVALDTDGTDGPTDIAGGIVDALTVSRARARGFDGHEHLKNHDSLSFLEALGDTILTGNTGTNVCDLNLVYIRPTAAM